METRIDFLRWLSKKLYLTSVGMYVTVITTMVRSSTGHCKLCSIFYRFILRATYESLVIYEKSVKSLSPPKMLFLVLIGACTMSFVTLFIQPKIDYFALPVAIFIAVITVGKLKSTLWPSAERTGFFHELPAKLDVNKFGTYGFYIFLVGIAYTAYSRYGVQFAYAFSAAFFIGMVYEELYNFIKLYDPKLTVKPLIAIIIWSAFCAVASTAIIIVMTEQFGYADQVATIASVMLLKLIQPLGSRKFILGV